MSENEKIGFIGLGLLGLPMATNLLNDGYGLLVYNRTASKAQPLLDQGAELVSRPVDTITPGGIVVTVVWDDAVLESIVQSEGFLEKLGAGGIHLSMTTILPETAKKLAALHAQHGCYFVEATVFGRPEAAAAKQLSIPYAGPQAAKERIEPLLKAMGGQGIFDFGEEIGAANVVKLVGNFLIFSANYSMREGLQLAEKNGVDPKAVVEMLTQTLFSAPIYKSYGRMLAEKTPVLSQSNIPMKDIGLFKSTAQQVELTTPVANLMESLIKSSRVKA